MSAGSPINRTCVAASSSVTASRRACSKRTTAGAPPAMRQPAWPETTRRRPHDASLVGRYGCRYRQPFAALARASRRLPPTLSQRGLDLGNEIGRGAMSVVYRATDRTEVEDFGGGIVPKRFRA